MTCNDVTFRECCASTKNTREQEKVQKRSKTYVSLESITYEYTLKDLVLFRLEKRNLRGDMGTICKYTEGCF